MSRSGRKKEKHGRSGDLSLDNCNDGTAARTRPLSFDEIIIRRKRKKSTEEVKEGATGAGTISGDCTAENVSDHHKSERHHRHNKDSSDGVDKRLSEEFVKLCSQRKEDSIPPNDSNSARRRDREHCESENKLRDDSLAKPKHREILRSEIRLKDESLVKENNSGESCRSELKSKDEMKEKFTKDKGKVDKKILVLGKNYERSNENSKDKAIKKHSRDLTGKDRKDRHEGRSGEKPERESKRKHRSGDDEKNGDRNAVKKQDLGKWRESEISERKERKESPKSRYGESRLKRRRSRSRECEERNRRSISVSPKAHKHTSYHGREHEDLSAHSSKGRSGRHHSDIDRSRGTSNGLTSHSRRHGGSTSGLGGYSPRKRRTEAAVKTPSPVNRSPEKKSAKWDVAPAETKTISDSVLSNLRMSNQNASSIVHDVVRATPITSTAVNPLDEASVTVLTKQNISVDSLQLTQATRPLRSLYADNVPASVSEKAVIEFLNNFLLSSGVTQIRGSQPCIGCVIQKDKGQALIEFLTPEDATAALSCDGSSFFGSILKIRRPKDFVEVANGEEEKSVAAVDVISDTVKDSPHKIFIGGISKTVSSKMIMEVASAFGPLKAYHFEVNEDRDEPCAFLEYVDQSVSQKACAGLSGMKLGGQVLTVVRAVSDGSSLENCPNSPFYGTPEHAVPLLEKPTQVLKLKNVFNPEGFSSLSDLEVEEVLEDVRLECARFGTVKSVNVVKYGDSHIDNSDMCEVRGNVASAGIEQNLKCDETNVKAESLEEAIGNQSEVIKGLEFPHDAKGVKEVDEVEEGNRVSDNNPVSGVVVDEPRPMDWLDSNMAAEGLTPEGLSKMLSQEAEQPNTLRDGLCFHEDKVACSIEMDGISLDNRSPAEEELNLDEVDRSLQEASVRLDQSVETHSDSMENGGKEKQYNNLAHIFEQGCVFVEYRRTEASCTAAHCLHGRLFDDRIVTVEYVPLDLYKKRFTK